MPSRRASLHDAAYHRRIELPPDRPGEREFLYQDWSYRRIL